MTGYLRRFLTDERGATAIEYALVAGIMALAIISIAAAGGALDGIYNRLIQIADALFG